jgi:hypothetical protein
MNTRRSIFRPIMAMTFFLSLSVVSAAQSIAGADAIPPSEDYPQWQIEVTFSPVPAREKVKRFFIVNLDGGRIIEVRNFAPNSSTQLAIYTGTPEDALNTVTDDKGNLKFKDHYAFNAVVENDQGKLVPLSAPLELLNQTLAVNKEVRAKARDAEDADVYISGELNGAHKHHPSFTTEISLQRYKPVSPSWRYTPFFKLNASTDPDADPDKMEAGLKLRYITGGFAGIPGVYFDHAFKLESERDFDNTNLIYDTRFTFLPTPQPKGRTNHKFFVNPYIGAELGKNLRSPLKAAEGDGIARALAGVDLRLIIFLKDEEAPAINWTTSYVRRWPLTDELGFKADDNGVLQLRRFGKSPRDFVSSKFSYRLTKFLDAFVAYEWGEVPPSYKLVDHRFRLGFAYKYKFAVK